MESDKDHIHYMIETVPNINLANFVKGLKSYITYHMWQKYNAYLSKCFWKEHTFFTDGYFIASVGNVSEEILKEYIENQGKWFMTIKELRKATGLSQSKFATYLGIPTINIQHWEQGVANPPEYVLNLIIRVMKLEHKI